MLTQTARGPVWGACLLALAARTGQERLSRGQRVCNRHPRSQQCAERKALRPGPVSPGPGCAPACPTWEGTGSPEVMRSGRVLSGAGGCQWLGRSRKWVCLSVPGEARSLRREPSLRTPLPRRAPASRRARREHEAAAAVRPAPGSSRAPSPSSRLRQLRHPSPVAPLTSSASLCRLRPRPGPRHLPDLEGATAESAAGESVKLPERPPGSPGRKELKLRSPQTGRRQSGDPRPITFAGTLGGTRPSARRASRQKAGLPAEGARLWPEEAWPRPPGYSVSGRAGGMQVPEGASSSLRRRQCPLASQLSPQGPLAVCQRFSKPVDKTQFHLPLASVPQHDLGGNTRYVLGYRKQNSYGY